MADCIDAWTHILPGQYFAKLQTIASPAGRLKRWLTLKTLFDLDERFRVMDLFSGYRQFLTPSGDAAADLARLMNNGLADLVGRFPDRFAGWCGALAMHDPSAAVNEIERIAGMGSAGVQIITSVRGAPLDEARFAPVFDAVAAHGMSIWLHPARPPTVADYPTETMSKYEIWWAFGWPYESSAAMARLVFSGLFDRHPDLRIITHHLGAMIPFFAGRIVQGWDRQMGTRTPDSDASLLPKPLERTAFQAVLRRHRPVRSGGGDSLRTGLFRWRPRAVRYRFSLRCGRRGGRGARYVPRARRTRAPSGRAAHDRSRQSSRLHPKKALTGVGLRGPQSYAASRGRRAQATDVARARRRWIREQGWLNATRLVFIDETAVTTNMVRLVDTERGRMS